MATQMKIFLFQKKRSDGFDPEAVCDAGIRVVAGQTPKSARSQLRDVGDNPRNYRLIDSCKVAGLKPGIIFQV